MALGYSDGIDQVARWLHPYNRREGEAWFPRDWDRHAGKQGGSEPLHDWFRRCVDDYFGGNPSRHAIEENCACFVTLRWVEESKLVHANAAVLVVRNESLDSYYRNGSDEVQYFRLDYHGARVGAMLKEPWPHIHIAEDGEPRFPLSSTPSGNILLDFFDFIYRNHFHAKWLEWAETVWSDRAARLGITPDPFPAIRQAFDAHQIPLLLGTYRPHLELMKQAWRENNDTLLPLFVDADRCRLLSAGG